MVLFWLALLSGFEDACGTGKAMFDAGSYTQAQQALWQCVEAGTRDKDAAHRLALTYRELKNYSEGMSRLQRVPDSIDRQYLQAFFLFRTGKHRDSLQILEQAYRRDQADWRIHHLFALNYVVLNIREGAEAGFENAIRLKPDNPELFYQLARMYYSDNRPRESIAAAMQALALYPEYPEAYDNLGLCYEALADNDNAAANFRKAIELNRSLGRKEEWPLLNYASFLIRRGLPADAVPLLKEAVAMNEASAKGYYLLGRALSKLGQNAEARSSLERAIELDNQEAGAYFELGMLLQKEGDKAGARKNLSRFEALRKGARP